MNIFVLDEDPILASQYQCNAHCVKMPLESTQILSSCFEIGDIKSLGLYRRTHYNHPCSIWVRQSKGNFEWLIEHTKALFSEYTYRYDKIHKSSLVLDRIIKNASRLSFGQISKTQHVQCFGEHKDECFVEGDPVLGYRNYYHKAKAGFAKWTKREKPFWWTLN